MNPSEGDYLVIRKVLDALLSGMSRTEALTPSGYKVTGYYVTGK